MKRAFVSYSIEDRNLHLITLLLEHLRRNNYEVSVSTQWGDSDLRIANADIFIGIITNNSDSIDYVIKEWKTAQRNCVPHVLVVENGVKIEDPESLSFIRFNRSNPQEAIDKLFNINKPGANTPQKKKDNNDTVSDVLIGVAVVAGIAALISLLSKNE
ncbi:MAG: toll/interleukin-1 receptor domain-containing protein [Bacteroidales bacterium]|nr:toll/interleukin-1 receptor domain-containing protein [Bacteroidales bacterium]